MATSRSCSTSAELRPSESESSVTSTSRACSGCSSCCCSAIALVPHVQSDGNGPAMGFESFGARERHGRRPKRVKACCIELEDRSAFHEVEHAKAGGEASA